MGSADFFVDPYAPRRLVLSVPLCCTTKTSSRWRSLRMTYSRGACALYFAFSGCTECPPTSLRGYTATLKAYANHSPRGAKR